jgi:hypothetical protein
MAPIRPPDVQRWQGLTTRGQRALASADASRYDLANRVFNAARPYFGPNARMPLVYWRSQTPDRFLDLQAEAAVPIAEAYFKGSKAAPLTYRRSGVVAYPYRQERWGMYPPYKPPPARDQRQHFMDILLHELAHTQQRPPAGTGGPRAHLQIEGGADAFAALSRDAVARRLGFGQMAPMPFVSGYGDLGSRFVRRYGPAQALYGQFGRVGPRPQRQRFVPFLTNPAAGTIGPRYGALG